MTKVTIELTDDGRWKIHIYEDAPDYYTFCETRDSLDDCLSYLADVRNYIKNFRKG